jgi:molecular chaperone HtpG
MLIPERLEEKLAQDRSLRRAVDDALAEFGPWLRESKLPFFPDYTDHGAGHVEGVLVTASSLIGDEAWAGVTAADATVLVLAALLHDCALHLTEEGFQALVSGSTHTKRVEGFGDAPWPELWQEFLFSAKRFDDRALTDLFGRPVAVRTPPADKEEMTHNDRLLIGEFVRRHHPRLAHEIAVRGFPGPHDNPIRLSERLDAEFADLAGLVARSHGLPLRATFDYLKEFYDLREYNGVHAVFLMAVLRVADYLQIKAERAPRQVLQVKEIRSPVSRGEWRAHHSVKSVITRNDDPEAVVVRAAPPDVRTYLRLRSWLGGIQAELDSSWAVLGEVYGRVEELNRLGLVIRRVRSNLDDERAFSRRVEYVPRRVEFDIARGEILKLLVRPLYGDKPEVGIRELLQNSVDAVRELWDLQEQNPSLRDADLIEQEADVVMWLDEPDETGRAAFTITDRGVGMTEEVITDYFLKVGASYRYSDAWAKQHERTEEEKDAEPDSDAAPRSRVLRSGRFGIGALAAFLLGDEIEVSTRHVSASKGIRFTTRLDSEPIELRLNDSLKVGTTIRIPITSEMYSQLSDQRGRSRWDWYCLSRPLAVRLLGRERSRLPQGLFVPGQDEPLPGGWHRLDEPEYSAVHYRFDASESNYGGRLLCNGIRVASYNVLSLEERLGEALKLKPPLVSVFDPDGKLPLDLTRVRITQDTELKRRLDDAFVNYLLAFLIVNTPSVFAPTGQPFVTFAEVSGRYALGESVKFLPWFYTAKGISIVEPWNILRAGATSWMVTTGNRPPASTAVYKSLFRYNACLLLKPRGYRTIDEQDFLPDVLFNGFRSGHVSDIFRGLQMVPMIGARVLTTKSFASEILLSADNRRGRRNFRDFVQEEWSDDHWCLLVAGSPPPTLLDLDGLGEPPDASLYNDPPIIAEWFIGDTPEPLPTPSRIAARWDEVIREPVIPYDPEERRRKLTYAYEVLAPYIEKFEEEARAEGNE